MEDICVRVGFNIRRMREDKAISQEKLAGLADLHRAYVGQIERGEKNIGLRNLEKIAKALKRGVEFMQKDKKTDSTYMKLDKLKRVLIKLISEIGEDAEVWLSCDEEGNEYLPMLSNLELSIAIDKNGKRVVFFPSHR